MEITANKVEKEFEILMKRKNEIEMNKSDLINDMDELDIKRKSALDACYQKINASFGKIFSSLLPNAFAKITPKDPRDVC